MKPLYIDCSPGMHRLLEQAGQLESLTVHRGDPLPAALPALIADAQIVVNGHTPMDAALLRQAGQTGRLKSIVFLGTGASSYIDVAAAESCGIRVRTVRGYGDRTVAEHAFGLLLAAARGTAAMDRGIRAGTWAATEGLELRGARSGWSVSAGSAPRWPGSPRRLACA